MSKKRVATLGEIMLRLSPSRYDRFLNTDQYNSYFGGGEANVAISLAQFGHNSCFVTKLPDNDIGQSAINSIQRFGVNTEYIIRGGERIGIYFSETGVSMRPSKIIYDRKHSSFSNSEFEEYDFEDIFKDCAIFHISGITPALGKPSQRLTLETAKLAKKMGVLVSLDYNYRKKLWTEKESTEFMQELLPYVDILLGYIPKGVNWQTKEINEKEIEEGFLEYIDKYDLLLMASTIRNSISASHNELYAYMSDGTEFDKSSIYQIRVVNRIGGGDAFTAGILSELLYGSTNKEALEFAVAASSWKHTIATDHNIASRDEILSIAKGNLSGEVIR